MSTGLLDTLHQTARRAHPAAVRQRLVAVDSVDPPAASVHPEVPRFRPATRDRRDCLPSRSTAGPPEELDELTPRKREVMGLVAAGLSNGEIAEHLVTSRATAKTHVSRTLLKLHARDRAQLVTLAYETGLVLPRQASVTGFDPPTATLAAA